MISFIIIGRNIERTIALCIESVYTLINKNKLTDYEIIYIDSDSHDNSVDLARKYAIKIIKLSGQVNSAIGRNVGVNYTKGDTLFFIDGDMELKPGFFRKVFNPDTQQPDYPFINGYWHDKYYDDNYNHLFTREAKIPDKITYRHVTGGLMIVNHELWEKVEGMDERLIRNQDIDIGLRFSKLGFPAKLYNHVFAIHHTKKYFHKSRIFDFFFTRSLFSPGLLMRKHLFYKPYLKRYYLNVTNVLILLCGIISLFFLPVTSMACFCLYLFIQLTRALKQFKKERHIILLFLFNILYGIYSLIGLLLYYPKKPVYKVSEVKSTWENN